MSSSETTTASSTVLSVKGLSVEFGTPDTPSRVVDDLSFSVKAGQTLAIVGESGSGKSISALSIMGLVKHVGGRIAGGSVMFTDRTGKQIDLTQADEAQMRSIRGRDIAMIFQEPMTSLNPVYTVGDQITETLRLHEGLSGAAAMSEARKLLEMVRLPDAEHMLSRYPHQLSGGMRQRVMIAMSLACHPKLLIADEPTTALDVTIQAQILNIIRDLQKRLEMAVIFITHDMSVVAEMADDVVVMWQGKKVEQAPVEEVFAAPRHGYTKALLSAVPKLGSMKGMPLPRREPLMVFRNGAPTEIGSLRMQDTADYSEPLLSVDKLTTRFDVKRTLFGRTTHRVHAVESVSFDIFPGETLALVGESGSGKSTIGRAIQQLLPPTSGEIRYRGNPVSGMRAREIDYLKEKVQYIFQDPFASLDPRKTVGFSIAEPIRTHHLIEGDAKIRKRVEELLEQVGLDPKFADRYPHEFSGGQRQRVCIARALAPEPELIIADEVLSALDVSIQAQIIDLFLELQERLRLSYLFISHDVAVVERMSHRIAVLYLGQVMELGSRDAVLNNPQHPYTRRLLAAVPRSEPGHRPDTRLIEGEIPSPIRQVEDLPDIVSFHEFAPGHFVADQDGGITSLQNLSTTA